MAAPDRIPAPTEYAPYYQKYIERVPAGDVVRVLEAQLADTLDLLGAIDESQAGHRYAEGKWSIREVVGHLADTERVMVYRALRIARSDDTNLPGFDENAFVMHSGADQRSLAALANELKAVRAATVALFDGLSGDAWPRVGTANNYSVSVRALAFIIAGHELHHREILSTRYLAAAPT